MQFGSATDFDVKPKKVTLGQQMIDNTNKYLGQLTQTVRETTDEMGKSYMDKMEEILNAHAHVKGVYYITAIQKLDTLIERTMRVLFVARRTRPFPEWGIDLYKVDNDKGEVTLEWSLPNDKIQAYLFMQAEDTDPKLRHDITAHLLGRLDEEYHAKEHDEKKALV